MDAPKDPVENSRYRRLVLQRAHRDVAFQEQLWIRCKRDMIYWIDTFCWSYNPKDYAHNPDRPFILWDYQQEAACRLRDSIGNHNMLVEKSREMGATWIILACYLWHFIFKSGLSFLVGSRKQEYVDKTGDPKTLLGKVDYLMDRLPGWMTPNYERYMLHFGNQGNGCTLDGESCNENFARGDRRTGIMLDEFPAVEVGYKILEAVGDATRSTCFVGTPAGASGAYYDIREKMMKANPERVIRLFWPQHPTKRLGLYTSSREKVGDPYVLEILDKDYKFPAGYPFMADGMLRSVAYDEREKIAPNPQVMAMEWNIDYLQSGWQFFEPRMIDEHIEKFSMDPIVVGEVGTSDEDDPRWTEKPGARLQLWFAPDIDGLPPADWDDCVVGVDVGMGGGGDMTSNSVISAWRSRSGEKIAQLSSQHMMPPDFALYTVAVCQWLNNAYLIWEANGPGVQFTVAIDKSGYRNVFYRQDELAFSKRRTRKPGFWTNDDTKETLLSGYATALKNNRAINRSRVAMLECREYINEAGGRIIHVKSKSSQNPASSGENHGDHVIADALAVRAFSEACPVQEKSETEPPPFSFGARQLAYNRSKKQAKKRRPLGSWRVY